MNKYLVLAIFTFVLRSSPHVNGQSISSVGTGKIVELESKQSVVTGTLIVAVMERNINNSTRVLIYRSVDNANTWSVIDSISPYSGDTEIPDPVVSSDASGNFYLALMRVNNMSQPSSVTVDIEVYRSLDDGQTWTLSGIPNFDDSIADYPQIIGNANGELFMVYSYIRGFPVVNKSTLTFKKSIDGGKTWSPNIYLGDTIVKSIGPDISQCYDSSLLVSVGDMDKSFVYSFSTNDSGNSWGSPAYFSISNKEKAHITKPLTNPIFDFYGILSHKAHVESTSIYYHASINGNPFSQILDTGSYAQGYITNDGIIHVTYSKNDNNIFKIIYRYSTDSGLTFSNPIPLYSQNYSTSAHGEYQSLVYGNDNLFYLTFCDWSDNSKAKTLVFPPLITLSTNENNSTTNDPIIYPNPVSDVFSIRLPNDIQFSRVKLIDMKGQILGRWIIQKGAQLIYCDITHLANTFYLIVLESENKILAKKLLKY